MFEQRLRLARRRAGLSMQDLATRVTPGVTAQAISKYETGRMMPSAPVLAGLGRALDTSLDFLMANPGHRIEGIQFRTHSSATSNDRAAAEVLALERLDDYFAMEDMLGTDTPSEPLPLPPVVDVSEAMERAAGTLRSLWGLGAGPVLSVVRLLEDAGVIVIEADLPRLVDGMACRAKRQDYPDTEVIVLRTGTGVEHKRLALAHELAHRAVQCRDDAALSATAADRFARAFLVPGAHLFREAGYRRRRMTYSEVVRLKRLYGIPAVVMLECLGQFGVLPQPAVTQAFRTFAHAWRRTEPEPIDEREGYSVFEHPLRLERLVWQAVGEQLVSAARAADILRVPIEHIERGAQRTSRLRAPANVAHRPPLAARRAPSRRP